MDFTKTAARRLHRLATWQSLLAIMVLGTALRALAFDPYATIHVDELMQYLERANRLVTGYGLVTWEQRFGIRNWIIPQLLAGPMWLGAGFAPGTLAPVILAKLTVAAAGPTTILAAFAIGRRQSEFHGLVAAFAIAIWVQCIYFSVSLLSENLAAIAILGGIGLAFADNAGRRRLFAAGLLLGLGLLFRFPYVVYVAIAAIGLNRTDPKRWTWMIAGGAAAIAIGAVSDLLAGEHPYAWLARNFQENIAAGKAERFGIRGPFYYPIELVATYGFGAGATLLLSLLCPPRYRFLLIAAAADMVAHSFLAHKELRFVYLSTTTCAILAATALVDLAERFAPPTVRGGLLPRIAPFYLLVMFSGSWWAIMQAKAPVRFPDPAARLVAQTVRSYPICGIAVSDRFRYQVPMAFLGRNIPIYDEHAKVGETPEEDPAEFPPPVASAANMIIAPVAARVPAAYHRLRCEQDEADMTCIFVRPGTCNPAGAAPYLLQNVLVASDL